MSERIQHAPGVPVLVAAGLATTALLAVALAAGEESGLRTWAVSAAIVGFAGFVLASALALRQGRAGPTAEAAAEADPTAPDPAPAATDEISAAMAKLASMASHELKNPLMSIKGLATTGSRLYESMSDEERKDFFRLIDDEASRLKVVAEETSTALKIDAGQFEYDIRPESISGIVEEVTWQAPHGEHPLTVEVEPDLEVPCDRGRIVEVLGHLLDNAVKFSPPGEPIQVRATSAPGGGAVVEVESGGPGIPVEARERAFERFANVRPTGYEEVPGAGLGLYISRAHVRAHGGRISMEDGPSGGTMLRFTLPATGG